MSHFETKEHLGEICLLLYGYTNLYTSLAYVSSITTVTTFHFRGEMPVRRPQAALISPCIHLLLLKAQEM